ncbi:hypothetical protein BS329_35775 [Amycolatopsis coloradensis]|uniref:Uncharacterized protein n=1 Tax=Amycolatopsis coloradensis TaxID=76021 RepID=A0A1R0KGG2_9PSEU|nr:hypothetical protein BS329_35775 [Amycolatopsis coloradensis]
MEPDASYEQPVLLGQIAVQLIEVVTGPRVHPARDHDESLFDGRSYPFGADWAVEVTGPAVEHMRHVADEYKAREVLRHCGRRAGKISNGHQAQRLGD